MEPDGGKTGKYTDLPSLSLADGGGRILYRHLIALPTFYKGIWIWRLFPLMMFGWRITVIR